LAGDLRLGHSGFKSLSRPPLRAACAARNTGGVHKNIGFDKSVRAASMRRREPNLPATFPPVACRGAVLRRACRMSERGTTGTANRQHPFIRAGGGRWQGSRRRLPAGGTARGKFGLSKKVTSVTVCPYPPTSKVLL